MRTSLLRSLAAPVSRSACLVPPPPADARPVAWGLHAPVPHLHPHSHADSTAHHHPDALPHVAADLLPDGPADLHAHALAHGGPLAQPGEPHSPQPQPHTADNAPQHGDATHERSCVSVFAMRGRLGGQTLAPTPYPTPKPSPEPPVFVSLNLTFVVRNVDTDAPTFNADYRSQGVIRVRHAQPLR